MCGASKDCNAGLDANVFLKEHMCAPKHIFVLILVKSKILLRCKIEYFILSKLSVR